MAAKKSTDVMIAGKVYTLSGYEEEGYLQHVASYINTKISEITEREEFRRIPNDMKSILIQLNIADDFFKAKEQFEAAEENYKKAEKDLFELKHELVDTQMKVEELLDKLNRERQERNQKSDRESRLEDDYRKLEEKYQLLLGNAKVADERNRQFEEMLRLTQQEKREVEAVNKELRLNKEKLEATLADALLGAAPSAAKSSGQSTVSDVLTAEKPQEEDVSPTVKKTSDQSDEAIPSEKDQADADLEKEGSADLTSEHKEKANEKKEPEAIAHTQKQELSAEDGEEFLTPAELSKEEIHELRETINETMAELSIEEQSASNQIDAEDQPEEQTGLSEEPKNQSRSDGSEDKDPSEQSDRPEDKDQPEQDQQVKGSFPAADSFSVAGQHQKGADDLSIPKEDDSEEDQQPEENDPAQYEDDFSEEDSDQGLFVTSKKSIPLTPGLSEEELAELLGPVKEPQPVMAELSKEELEELLAPTIRHEITDEGPLPDPDDEDDFISSVMSEVSEDDDPEIQDLARQIAELERQEQEEKNKKKTKKNKKRKH